MVQCKILIPLFVVLTVLIGCGGGSKGDVKKGDIVELTAEIRERAETQWDIPYTDGFISVIPAGTKLKVLYNPAPASQVFECTPIEVNGKTDEEEVEMFFVPEHIRNKEGYRSYSFALKKELLGTKIKKVK